MKKLILLSTIILTVLSCSKKEEEDPNVVKNIPVNNVTISGTWYPKQVIQANGSLAIYNNLCAAKKDSVYIFQNIQIHYYQRYNTCTDQPIIVCTSPALTGNKIEVCNDVFDGTITELTNNTMVIDYGVVRSLPYFDQNFTNCKGIVLSRER